MARLVVVELRMQLSVIRELLEMVLVGVAVGRVFDGRKNDNNTGVGNGVVGKVVFGGINDVRMLVVLVILMLTGLLMLLIMIVLSVQLVVMLLSVLLLMAVLLMMETDM